MKVVVQFATEGDFAGKTESNLMSQKANKTESAQLNLV